MEGAAQHKQTLVGSRAVILRAPSGSTASCLPFTPESTAMTVGHKAPNHGHHPAHHLTGATSISVCLWTLAGPQKSNSGVQAAAHQLQAHEQQHCTHIRAQHGSRYHGRGSPITGSPHSTLQASWHPQSRRDKQGRTQGLTAPCRPVGTPKAGEISKAHPGPG